MIIWSMIVFIQNDLMVWCTCTFSVILFCWLLYIPGNGMHGHGRLANKPNHTFPRQA